MITSEKSKRWLNPNFFKKTTRPSKKDWYRAARASGHYPLTFNFIFIRHDKHIQCSYCGRFVLERNITKDHVWPKSKGGLIKTPCCITCNIAKEDMKPIEFAIWASEIGLSLGEVMYEP